MDEGFLSSIGELLEACGWFENNEECSVDSISVNGSAVRIHIS